MSAPRCERPGAGARRRLSIAGLALCAKLACLAGLALFAACARMAPPGGGPEDRDAPRVLSFVPDSGAVQVPADAPLSFLFSEAMNRSGVLDALRIAPWPGQLECKWEDLRLTCRPVEGWRPNTTYTTLLGAPAADRRRNALERPLSFAFATGDSLERGSIEGTLHTRSITRANVPIFLFEWPDDLAPPVPPESPYRPDPLSALRVGEADGEGRFRMSYVPVGRPMLAAALYDQNKNRDFDEEEDLWGFSETPVTCPAGDSALARIDLYLVYGDEEGDLAGTVTDSSCADFLTPAALRQAADSLAAILSGERDPSGFPRTPGDTLAPVPLEPAERESITVELARVQARIEPAALDSARCTAPIWVAAVSLADSSVAVEVRTSGAFRLEALPPGIYRIEAFRDLSGDASPQADEPSGRAPGEVLLKPGREVDEIAIELHAPPGGSAP